VMPQSHPIRVGVRDRSTAAEFAAFGAIAGTRSGRSTLDWKRR
jgi:hypothetical protein